MEGKSQYAIYDIPKLLPPELWTYVMLFLDHEALMNCQKTSSLWNQIIKGRDELWLLLCKKRGWDLKLLKEKVFVSTNVVSF